MSNLYIYSPTSERRLQRAACRFCGVPRWFIVWLYDWYGGERHCLKCGGDGHDMRAKSPREINKTLEAVKRRWRKENKR